MKRKKKKRKEKKKEKRKKGRKKRKPQKHLSIVVRQGEMSNFTKFHRYPSEKSIPARSLIEVKHATETEFSKN